MGLNNFILTCEKDNEELRKNINYYKNMVSRLKKENQELKKQVEEWKHHLKCSKEMLDIQGQKGNYDFDEYMLGLYNGMEYIISLFETREPKYIDSKDVKFTDSKATKFIKFLEDNYNLEHDIWYIKILQKYKEIIGVSDENN